MRGLKQCVCGSAAAAAIACAPVAPAVAHGHGHFHGWELGRDLVGAVVVLATLPIAIVSTAIAASEQELSFGYVPRPYYSTPQTYYAPPSADYPGPSVYYPGPRAYYAPQRGYYGPRTRYAPGAYSAPRAVYGNNSYRLGYPYPPR